MFAKHNVMLDNILNTKLNLKNMCNTFYYNTLGDIHKIYGDFTLDVFHGRETSPLQRLMSDEELHHILYFICTS